MPVQMIQSDVSRSNVYQDALKGFASPVPSITGGAGRLDSYKRVDPSVAKFVVPPTRYLAQVSKAKPPSYRSVSSVLKVINNPSTQALRNHLAKKGAAVVPILLKTLKDRDKVVRSGSAEVLGRIFQGTGASNTWKAVLCKLVVVPRLTALLKDRDADVRKAAKKAIDAINRKKTIKPPETDKNNIFE